MVCILPESIHAASNLLTSQEARMSQTTSTIRSMGFFLNGGWSTHGRESVVTSPYDHSVIAVVSEAGHDDVEVAIQSAVEAFAVTRRMSSHQRAAVLQEITQASSPGARNLPAPSARKPASPSRPRASRSTARINTFQIAAEEATRIYGEYIAARHAGIDRRPLGTGTAISAVARSSPLRRSTFR